MKQFDVYQNPISKGREIYPYVCCLQSELLHGLSTRVIVFVANDASFAFDKVSVPIKIKGQNYFLCMNVLATIESNRLVDLIDNVIKSRNKFRY